MLSKNYFKIHRQRSFSNSTFVVEHADANWAVLFTRFRGHDYSSEGSPAELRFRLDRDRRRIDKSTSLAALRSGSA
jgi:hypothetical protein